MSRHDGRHSNAGRNSAPSYLQLVRDNMPPLAPTASAATETRRRIEIVPLDGPAATAPPATIPRLAPVAQAGDRRQSWPGRDDAGDPATRLVCPSCGVPARVDVVDLRTRRLHLSCDNCYRMWQDRVRVSDKVPAGLQRVR